MKKLFCALALVCGSLGSMGAAQAQVYFDSGSAHPNNPHAARRDIERQRAHLPLRARHALVRCRDGARREARFCRGHGGVARR